jgi:hypothetical protein
MACTYQRTRTGLVLESFHTGGQLSDLILEALRVAEEINKYLSLPPHLMGTIFEDLRIVLQLISLLKNMGDVWLAAIPRHASYGCHGIMDSVWFRVGWGSHSWSVCWILPQLWRPLCSPPRHSFGGRATPRMACDGWAVGTKGPW